jgi:L-aminopeptidase/D-esterase-like protein
MHSFNGNGEMTGSHWVAEAGHFTGPVCITNTNAIGAAHEGVLRWMLAHYPSQPGDIRWFLPVVAETYDGYLNDIERFPVRPEHVAEAIAAAISGPIAEGVRGGGTGMMCYGFKGGSGTSSRVVANGDSTGDDWTVGAFVQANFGRRGELMMCGRPVGRIAEAAVERPGEGLGSIIVVLATDAPMHSRQLEGLARRATMGVARTGAVGSHGSGDIFLAFSTAPYPGEGVGVPDTRLTAFFDAAAASVEEAILNALVGAETLTGYLGHTAEAIDHGLIRSVFP